jgi:hypothetical protein
MASSRSWPKGCALGCGGLILLTILGLVIMAGILSISGGKTIKAREKLETACGTAADFTPWSDGRIPPDRLERYIAVRRELFPRCAAFMAAADKFRAMAALDSIPEDKRPSGRQLMNGVGHAIGGMITIVANLNAYLLQRNQLLLEHEMSLAEWTYLHVMIYYAYLGHDPRPFVLEEEHDVARVYTTRVRGEIRDMIARHVEDPLAAARDPDLAQWIEALKRLREDPERIPFRGDLPPRLQASLSPLRTDLEALWCPATDEVDLSITTREGPGFEHI